MDPLDKPPIKLLFQDASFVNGVQSTCRLGVKWSDYVKRTGRTFQDVFVTGYEDRGRIGVAEVVGALTGSFAELAELAAQTNHVDVIQAEGVDALVEAMEDAYGDQFNENAAVTVLFFKFSGDERERVEEDPDSPDELLYGGKPGGDDPETVVIPDGGEVFIANSDLRIGEGNSEPVDAVSTTQLPPAAVGGEGVVKTEPVA